MKLKQLGIKTNIWLHSKNHGSSFKAVKLSFVV